MAIRPGDVILATLKQADGEIKLRPVVVLSALPGRFSDVLVCAISTRIHQQIQGWGELISADSSDFAKTGLTTTSIARLGHLETVNQRNIRGAIGRIDVQTHRRLVRRLIAHLETSK